jgi:hypothetical protein
MFVPMIMFADCECDGGCDCTCFTTVPIIYTKEDYIETFNMIEDCINELATIKFWQFNKKRITNRKLMMLTQRRDDIVDFLSKENCKKWAKKKQ